MAPLDPIVSVTADSVARLWFEASIKTAVLLGLAAAAAWACRGMSAAMRHRIWSIGLCSALLLPVLSLCVPPIRLAVLPPRVEPVAGSPRADNTPMQGPVGEVAASHTLHRDLDRDAARNARAVEHGGTGRGPGGTPESAAFPPPEPETARGLGQYIGVAWAIGLLLMLAPIAAGMGTNRWLLRRARRLDSARWLRLIAELSSRIGLRRAVAAFESSRPVVPMTWGVIRPAMLLPSSWREWPSSRQRLVMLHELAHVKRMDALFQLVGRLAAALYWMNPLAWYALRRLRIERELACDDCVIASGERATDYARELVQVARLYRSPRLAIAIAMARSARLDERVAGILDSARPRLPVGRKLASGMVGLAAILTVMLAATRFVERPVAAADAVEGAVGGAVEGAASDPAEIGLPNEPQPPALEIVELLARLKARDDEFLKRSLDVERRWVEPIDPRAVLAAEQRKAVTAGRGDLGPPVEPVPDPYDQPHRAPFRLTVGNAGVLAIDNAGDLAAMKHPRYGPPVEPARWVLPPLAWNRVMMDSRARIQQEWHRIRQSFEWSCGYGFASAIRSIESMQRVDDGIQIRGESTVYSLHPGEAVPAGASADQPIVDSRFDLVLDDDLIVRRAVIVLAVATDAYDRIDPDAGRVTRIAVETQGTVRLADAPPVAAQGRWAILAKDVDGEEHVWREETFRFLQLSPPLADEELSRRADPNRELFAPESTDPPPAQYSGAGTRIPFRVRSRRFEGGDELVIESLVEVDASGKSDRYEVRGRYRLESRPEAEIAQWCANGEVRGKKSMRVKQGEGAFRLTFSVIKPGDLHISYYPIEGGASFGSIYYEGTGGQLRGEQLPEPRLEARPGSGAAPGVVGWKTEETEFFRLHYAPEQRADAERIRGYLDRTVESLQHEFGPDRVLPLLTSASIDVYVQPRPMERAREGLVSLHTETRGGMYHARIDILAPSAHAPGSKTSVGEPMDDNYIFKNLVHEYSTIVLDRLTQTKPSGWRFFSAPSWFVQGYEEYLGLMLSSEHSRRVTFEKIRDLHRKDRNRVTPQFETQSPYLDGPVLLEFMHDVHGKEKVQALLASDAADFWSAVLQELGEDRAGLHRAWLQWLEKIAHARSGT